MTDRQQIDVPAEVHDRFMEVHEEIRPAEQAPKWNTVVRLLDLYDEDQA